MAVHAGTMLICFVDNDHSTGGKPRSTAASRLLHAVRLVQQLCAVGRKGSERMCSAQAFGALICSLVMLNCRLWQLPSYQLAFHGTRHRPKPSAGARESDEVCGSFQAVTIIVK